MIPSTAYVCYRPDGPAQVDASLRLTGSSHIQCSTYEDRPAILSVTDAHVSVSISVPDSAEVTVDDLDVAVRLAEALADYIADLRRRCPLTTRPPMRHDQRGGPQIAPAGPPLFSPRLPKEEVNSLCVIW